MSQRNLSALNNNRIEREESIVNAMDFGDFFKETREVINEIITKPDYLTNKKLQARVKMIKAGIVSQWENKQFWDAIDENDEKMVRQMLGMFKNDTKDLIQKIEISGPDGDPLENVTYLEKRDRDLLMSVKDALIERPKKLTQQDLLKEENE